MDRADLILKPRDFHACFCGDSVLFSCRVLGSSQASERELGGGFAAGPGSGGSVHLKRRVK